MTEMDGYNPDFPSRFLRHPRPVIVHLPPDYETAADRRYPVFYLHDGQNLFDDSTAFAGRSWRADETADRLALSGEAAPVILVGVGNTPDRLFEYGPRRHGHEGHDTNLAEAYGRFLVEEVKPFIDAEYRTLPGRESTAVGGSSMGGLISLHLCRWHPEAFGACAAMSPSLWWDREYFLRSVKARAGWVNECRVWLCMGGREGHSEAGMRGNMRRARALAKAFRELGRVEGRDWAFHEDPHAEHTEAAWGARFENVLRFLFPTG